MSRRIRPPCAEKNRSAHGDNGFLSLGFRFADDRHLFTPTAADGSLADVFLNREVHEADGQVVRRNAEGAAVGWFGRCRCRGCQSDLVGAGHGNDGRARAVDPYRQVLAARSSLPRGGVGMHPRRASVCAASRRVGG